MRMNVKLKIEKGKRMNVLFFSQSPLNKERPQLKRLSFGVKCEIVLAGMK